MTTSKKPARLFACACASVFLLAVAVVSTRAQTNKADIVGTVTDQNGAVVSGATVTITKVDTNAERVVTTGDAGQYEASRLEIGTYKVTASKQGFQTVTHENIVLQINDRLRVDITLQPGTVTGVVTVTAAPPMVETETSDRGNVVTGREVTELPLQGRNFTLLATLTPGVAQASNAGFGGAGPDARQFNNGDPRAGSGGPGASNAEGDTPTTRFARSGSGTLTVNGQRPTNNNFALDGVDNNEPQFGSIGIFPNPDAIAEFKVTTSVPPAEVGRASGAVVNVTTLSGTNSFHGSAYYYGQSSALNALHPILKRDIANAIINHAAVIPRKAVTRINEFGGTIGGPIIKNKLFFFDALLLQRNDIPHPFASSVPTALSRNGNFSEFASCPPPHAGIKDPNTGERFPGDIIPAQRIDPIAQKILNLYPLPTINIPCPSQGNNNFFGNRRVKERINNNDIKIDFNGAKNSVTGRWSEQRLNNLRDNFFPIEQTGSPGLPTAGFGAGEEVGNARQIVLSDRYLFNPSLINEFRFGFTQVNIGIHNCGVLGACGVSPTWAKDIGIPNVNLGGPETTGGAGIGFVDTGFVEFLGDGGLFQAKSKNAYFGDTVTIIKGRHSWKAGGELRSRFLNTVCGGCAGFEKGAIGFGDFNGAGNSQANALLGITGFAQRSRTIGGPFDLRWQEYGLFVQDDWKANDRLTLNLGLRWDLLPGSTAPTEKNGRISYYFPDQRKVVVASGSGDRIVSLDKHNFGPHLGFAYAVNKAKTLVARGGYAIVYTLDGIDYPPAVRNPPFTNISFSNWTLATGPPLITNGIDPNNLPTGTNLFAVDPQQRSALVHMFHAGVQYEFHRNYSLDVGYVGNRSRNLLATFQLGSGGQGIALNNQGQLIGSVLLYSNAARSSYDGLQTQLRKRFSHNVQGGASYTWSHTIDNNTGIFNGLGDSRSFARKGPVNPFDLNFDRGNSVLDIRHLFSADAIIDLPFGKGQRYLNHGGASDKIVGGWQLNIVENARSGFAFGVVCQNALVHPVIVGNPFSNAPTDRFMSASAFLCAPPVVAKDTDPFDQVNRNNPANAAFFGGLTEIKNAAGQTVRFGNLGRNTFRGPAIWNTNLSIFKNTRVTENTKIQIGMEFFNLFNHTNLTVPNNDVTDPGSFGRFNGAFPGRVIQYRFKFIF